MMRQSVAYLLACYSFLFSFRTAQAWQPTSTTLPGKRQRRGVIVPPLQQSSVDTTALSRSKLGDNIPSASSSYSSTNIDTTTSLVLPKPPPLSSVSVPLIQLALAGSLTTFFADAVIHPIDCIKTFQQQHLDGDMGFWDSAVHLWQTGGLFQGLWTYAGSDAIGGALKFSVWEAWKKKTSSSPRSVLRHYNFIGAALAFAMASIVIAPGEFLKQQLQMAHFTSLGQAMISIYEHDGIGGFFVGYDAVVLRDIPHTMLELCLYDTFKRLSTSLPSVSSTPHYGQPTALTTSTNPPDDEGRQPAVRPVLAAGGTGCVAGFLTTPMDTLKTQVMASGHDASIAECLQQTLDGSGWVGLWAGALARVLWIAPFTMLYLPTYDSLHKILKQRHLSSYNK